VNGTSFANNSVVRWNGADRATNFVSATQLTAQITAADIANFGTATVTVFTPAPGGGTSNTLSFTINQAPNPVPTLTSLNPNAANAGGAAFTLAVNGTNFVNGATVRWNGANRPTLFLSATQLSAQIPASDIATAGTAQISVFNPASASGGGGASNTLTFTINQTNPAPALTSLSPTFALAGGGAFNLTVNGSNFVSAAIVRWNGEDRPTTFVSATQLRAAIPAADLVNAGAVPITVFNPAPGGGTSAAVNFAVAFPLANVSAASFSATEFAADMVVSAFGSNLATGNESATAQPLPTTLRGTTVRVRDSVGAERLAPLFFVSVTQVNYLIPAGTANGPATVIITSADGRLSAANISITAVAPGLFTANANGQGVPAGFLLRVDGNGKQTFEPIATTSPTGRFVPLAIDLGPESDQLFLVLFGTGFRNRSSLSAVTATIGGVNAEVVFAATQGDLAGLDQTNIRLPRSLGGRGEVELLLRVDGKAANPVRIAIK
jgi:uncharacterized protein (TIGR03437 family)